MTRAKLSQQRAAQEPAEHLSSSILTMELGLALTVLLGLMFISGGLFYLYIFDYNHIGPYFTVTRVLHFYVGIASVPFLLAKYGSTLFRFTGYYLRLPRFKRAGPPKLVPRITSPLLAIDFFVLYFSGAYMLFHYYYTVTNIPPWQLYPVQLHLWAAILAVPLLAIHLGSHFLDMVRGLAQERRTALTRERSGAEAVRPVLSRRAFMGTVIFGALGLSLAFQNSPAVNANVHGLFIGRIPTGEKNGPGDFPTETLFGVRSVDANTWRLHVTGTVGRQLELRYQDLLALPAVTKTIRISCVSGWTAVPTWTGPRVRDVLALAQPNPKAAGIDFHSVTGYGWAWPFGRILEDDALLATHVNGAPLSNEHGFPVRLIVPGFPGENMVKQLDRITVGLKPYRFDPNFKVSGLQ